MNDYDGAVKSYDAYLTKKPNDYAVLLRRADAKFHLQQFEEAIKDYDRVLELHPEIAIVYNNRGRCKYNLKLYTAACEDLKKAYDLGYKHGWNLLKKNCE